MPERAFEQALPDYGGTVRLKGLDAPVEILRDGLGIPHIRARTIHDAFFAQGFAHAQDRLWQMEYDRVRSAGRLAAYLGRPAVTLDVFARRMGLAASARADYSSLAGDDRLPLDAYAAGVNAFLDSARALPVELSLLGITPEPWRPWDCAVVMKIRHVLMGSMHAKLWRARVLGALGPGATAALTPANGREDVLISPVGARALWAANGSELEPGVLAVGALADGSNNWAVHGSRTASGMPMVAGDPHRILEVPNVYYQNRIACPAFDAIGLSMPGVPGIFHFGHNGSVAWCITHAMADTQDLFVERFDREGRHLFGSEWRPSERREEVVDVRGSAPLRIDVTVTRHGPVLYGDPATGAAVALRWTGTDAPNATLRAVLPMLRASTVDELDESMRSWVDPCNNFVMADVHGTIGYLYRGRVPVRPASAAWAPVPGWTGEHEWTGNVPFEELPRLRNPEAGFIVTANNRICDRDYPHHLGMDYSGPNRAGRIVERLAALKSATPEDMTAIHSDSVSAPSRAVVEAVKRLRAPPGRAALARELLLAWDSRMDRHAAAPSVYATIRDELAGVLLERDPLSRLVPNPFPEEPLASSARTRLRSAVPKLLASGETSLLGGASWDEVVGEALDRAVASLEASLGGDPAQWLWGRLHTTQTRHPLSALFPEAAASLDPAPVPIGGDGDTVLATTAEAGLGVQHASVARYVFDLGDWDRSGWVIPLGASGHPASPHYADQSAAWGDVRVHPMTYTWERVEAGAETRQALEPR